MANEMTVKELLTHVRDDLNKIRIPASEMQNIGIPLAQAIGGLTACIDAINEAEAKQAEEPQIELVPVEEAHEDA